MSYAELHCVSNFSFLRGASHPAELVYQAHRLGYVALALTDECSMAGIVRAYEAANACGLKLIVGSEFRTSDGLRLVLLAPTQRAYTQICTLITTARRRSSKGNYQLSRDDLASGLDECLALWIPPRDPPRSQAHWMRERFPGRVWIAVELHREADDARHLHSLRVLSEQTGMRLVAAGDVHMHVKERRALQDTLTAIRHRCTLAEAGHRLFPNGERYLRPYEDLAELYPKDLLDETLRIADLCAFSLKSLRYRYPRELVPDGKTPSEHLRELTEAGLANRWPAGVPANIRQMVEKELALIAELEYEPFFLTVHELVSEARRRNILCQGRGSAANSVVCYALGITEVSPENIDVLFERFISKERNEPPDIDVDFEHERREEIIQYVFDKYGRERAALAATVICYRSRSAIRDVGKALGLGLDVIDRLAKSQTYWDDFEALQANLSRSGLHVDGEIARLFCARVRELLGFPRHLSQHVGGFVISENPINEIVPIENAAMPNRTVIQWEKNDLEALGLLKVDVLALGMLTAIRKTFELLKKAGRGPRNLSEIPREDPATYDMICRAETIGVFQIESRAQMTMLPRLRPRCYYDLVIEVAIVRPGPIQGGMVHPYLRRRLDPSTVSYPSPELEEVLKKTLGVPIFQEQVMQIAIKAAGFTPGQADLLRRSMAAWNRSGTMHLFKQQLIDGMLTRGYSREFAEQIFRQIEGFGEYGFPESHAASFALLTYFSSYLKCHWPAAFIAALINSQPMGFYRPPQLLEEAKRQGVTILPIDVLASDWDCTLEQDNQGRHAIRLGTRLVRGLREQEGAIISEMRARQPYSSMEDFCARTRLTKRAIRALALAGAFRSLTAHRRAAYWQALGVERLPGMLAHLPQREGQPILPAPTAYEEVLTDYEQLGFSTQRHLLELLRDRLRKANILTRREIEKRKNGDKVRVAGLITHLQRPGTAAGIVFASLEDETGINNVVIKPEVFDAHRHVVLQANLMVVSGTLQSQDGLIHVVAEQIEDYSHWIVHVPRTSRDFQ
ncbi:MAG: error-prone DNA polymerase [Gammaproteobacteria bacterium]|nr:error-prone DNA polymerase [Gammaproteobacteria bacterium]